MLSIEEIISLAPFLKDLEYEEPLIAAWRCEAGRVKDSPINKKLHRLLGTCRDFFLRLKSLPMPASGQAVVFPISSTPNTAGSLFPIMKELYKRNKPVFLITKRNTRYLLKERLHKGYIDLSSLISMLGLAERIKIHHKAKDASRKFKKILEEDCYGNSEQWLEYGMLVREAAKKWLGNAGMIIMDSEQRVFQKGIISAASSLGIPSVVLQHGLIDDYSFPLHANFLFCCGDYFKRQTESFGVNPSRVVVVGCPRWDMLSELRFVPKDLIIPKRLSNTRNKPLVLLISNTHGASFYPLHFKVYFEGVKRLVESDMNVIIKLHPIEKGLTIYKEFLDKNIVDKLKVVPEDIDLYEAIRHSDVVCHAFSTAALEAMLLGVPVLFIFAKDTHKICDFPDYGGGEWCEPKGIIERCTALGVKGSARDTLIAKQDKFTSQAIAYQGQATKVAVDFLERLVS